MWELCPFWNLKYWKYSFPHFSLSCFDILSSNFAYDIFFTVLQIKFECCQFALMFVGVMPLWNLEYWKYTVFRTFLLHALTYWAEILHMTLFHRTTDQVRLSWICVNFCSSNAPFERKMMKYTVFALFSYMLWLIELKFCIWLCFNVHVLQIKFKCRQFQSLFVGVMPLL